MSFDSFLLMTFNSDQAHSSLSDWASFCHEAFFTLLNILIFYVSMTH